MATGAAIGIAVAGIAAAVASSANTEKTNQANKDLMREQMSYQTGEREAAEQYNSPVNQRQLYEQAGFNPYLALGNMPSGETQAQTGVQLPQMIKDNGLEQLFNSLGSAGVSFADLNIKQQQAEQLGIDNQIKTVTLQNEAFRQSLELQQRKQDIINSSLSADEKSRQIATLDRQISVLDTNLKYLDEYNESRNLEQKNRANLFYHQAVGQQLENEAKEIYNRYLPSIQESTLNKINAAAADLFASAVRNKQAANLLHEQGITEFTSRVYKNAGLRLDNEQKDIVNSYLGEQLQTAIDWQRTQIRQGKQDIENPFRYFGNAILGAGIGAIGTKAAPKVIKGFSR